MTVSGQDGNLQPSGTRRSRADAVEAAREGPAAISGEAFAHLVCEQTNQLFFLCDRAGTLLKANPAALAAIGAESADTPHDPLWQLLGRVDAPAATRLRQMIDEAATGTRARCEVKLSALGAGEESVSVVDVTISPIRDAGEQIVALLAEGRDITLDKLRDAENARNSAEILRQSDRRFLFMFENAAIGIAHTTFDGQLILVNRALREMLGYSPEEFSTLNLQMLIHPEDWERNQRMIDQLLSQERTSFTIEKRYRHKLGHYLWVGVTVSLMHEEGGAKYMVGFANDLTQRKAAEEQLRQLNETLEQQVAERTALAEDRTRQLRRLASELTQVEQRERRRLAQSLHDHLQQLIAAARMSLSPVRKRLAETPHAERLRSIDELLEESIEVSRSLAFDLSPPVLHDAGMSAALTWLARHMQGRYNLQVTIDANPDAEPTAEYTSVFLFQSVRELLLNIVKHAETREATVAMDLYDSENVRIVVGDKGRGFDPSSGPDLAEVEGFGLFSIRERLELLGGQMKIESGIGQGATITIIAPRHAPTSEVQPRTRSTAITRLEFAHLNGQTTPIRVLLVDDHKLVRQGLAGLLSEEEDILVIGEAADGLEAIELAQELMPDVIVMDVTMPHLDGVAATRQISERQPNMRIIGLSMHESDDLAAAMQAAGARDYLPKNGPLDQLTAAIRRANEG